MMKNTLSKGALCGLVIVGACSYPLPSPDPLALQVYEHTIRNGHPQSQEDGSTRAGTLILSNGKIYGIVAKEDSSKKNKTLEIMIGGDIVVYDNLIDGFVDKYSFKGHKSSTELNQLYLDALNDITRELNNQTERDDGIPLRVEFYSAK